MSEEKKKINSKVNKKDNKKDTKKDKKEIDKKVTDTVKKDKKVVVEKEVKEEVIEVEEKVKEESTSKNGFFKKHLGDILLVVGVLVLVVGGMFLLGSEDEEGDGNLIGLTYSEYEDLIDSNEPFVFIIESANCGHCQTYMPIVEKFANINDVTIYYIDVATLDEDEYVKLNKSNTFFTDSTDGWGTPTTMILNGNTAVDTLIGAVQESDLKEFLVKNGIME